ncbi:MAG: imidazole glycerol phosphate synthase subunit HisH [Hyphomonadaceae bacterium]
MTTAVVKLGVGNTASVMFALERLGAPAVLTDDAVRIAEADRIILPGVGAAAYAMELIDAKGLRGALTKFERPLLGICLGQQLLFEASEEGDAQGLGLLPGRVTRLPSTRDAPAPHMGWSKLALERAHPLIDGVADGAYVYFVHSYVCPLGDATIASAEYGARFAAIVGDGRVFGCQFHPERSGDAGARILSNFLSLPC